MLIKTEISVLIIYILSIYIYIYIHIYIHIPTYIPIYIHTHNLAPEVINQQIITNLNTNKKTHGL